MRRCEYTQALLSIARKVHQMASSGIATRSPRLGEPNLSAQKLTFRVQLAPHQTVVLLELWLALGIRLARAQLRRHPCSKLGPFEHLVPVHTQHPGIDLETLRMDLL